MDADFSHSPKELIRNLNYFKKNKLDLLISSRYLKDSRIINWPLSRRIFSKLSNILAYLILRINVSDYTNGFRIYSNKSIKIILNKCGNIGDGFIILSEILLAININKLKIGEIHSKFVNRLRGESNVNIYLIFNSLYGLFKLFLIKKKYLMKKNEI
jgi:dolichol-phosphate mannosyltransferase